MLGQAGIDVRGLWINDPDTGTRFRAGHIGYDLAAQLTAQQNRPAAREALRRQHWGVWFSKDF